MNLTQENALRVALDALDAAPDIAEGREAARIITDMLNCSVGSRNAKRALARALRRYDKEHPRTEKDG